ncbi:MAG: hypothetical protein Q9P01_16765 [Anaerolineae bacterium]|nr:hypothetical protein [Anaerolineae bacterium]MDQ7036417.1 hypothetical protein [Anaerolineae bacterium]
MGILTQRNVMGTFIIIIAVTLCTISVAFGLFGQCITTYTNEMPIYDGAELVESDSSLLNYLGLGTLRTVWFVEAEIATVEQWYDIALNDMRQAIRDAQRNGETPPPLWDANWTVVAVEGGSQVQMQAACF